MKRKLRVTLLLAIALVVVSTTGASAQLTVLNGKVPAGFAQAGIIQQATLNAAPINAGDSPGGTLTINGITMIVPDNTVVQMPANTLKWADLFEANISLPVYDSALPLPVQPNLTIPAGTTGLALIDNPAQDILTSPWIPSNATVMGNIDVGNSTGNGIGAYIVGLILPIGQDGAGAGFITFIDYARGRFEVGGTLHVRNTGTVIEINDPTGRYGHAHSPDPRWSVDSDNPTVSSGNGYPMGLPRVAPAGGRRFPVDGEVGDPDRPYYNRLKNRPIGKPGHDPFLQAGAALQSFTMPAKTAPNAPGVITPDPWKQAPLMLGDYVSFEGILCKNDPNVPLNTTTPFNRQTYISAHTVKVDKLAIYTAPGSVEAKGPCYVQLAKGVIGNGGAAYTVPAVPALGILGGTIPQPAPPRNITITGFVTDPSQLVDIYAVDIVGGVEQPRLLGTVLPQPGTPGAGRKGSFVFNVDKGNFLPATRMYMARSRHGTAQVPNQTGNITPPQGGLISGQYSAPMFIYEFADAALGFPVIPFNFNTMPFLTQGEEGNPSPGPLNPQPPIQ